MRKLIFVCAALCMSVVARSQTWTLEWSDEFNGTSLNQAYWSYETGTGVNGISVQASSTVLLIVPRMLRSNKASQVLTAVR